MSKISDSVFALVKPIAEQLGLTVVDVTYEKKFDGMNLTVVIDKEGGVDINDCEALHRAIDLPLDELNPTDDAAYTLNVSSPGLDRPITTDWDFKKHSGKEIEVRLYAPDSNGAKKYIGKLINHDENTVTVEIKGQEIALNRQKIAIILPVIKF